MNRELRGNKKQTVEFRSKEPQPAPAATSKSGASVPFAPFLDAEGVYALEIRGESMIDDHILEGDCALVEKTQQARNGEIVVALVDGKETTLQRFYLEGGRVRLQPANSAMEPTVVPAERVRIRGRVLAVHRRYSQGRSE